MNFECKEISINDEDLGCQIKFSENLDLGSKLEKMSFTEIINSIGKYLLLQRFYEADSYYFETHDENICGDLIDFDIKLSRNIIELNIQDEVIKILINPTEQEYAEIKRVLPIIIKKKGKLSVTE